MGEHGRQLFSRLGRTLAFAIKILVVIVGRLQKRVGAAKESAADAQTKVQDSLTAFGDALTTFVIPAIAAYQKAGETSGAALNRLATSLTTVNSAFSTLNLKLMETSLQGADAADKLTAQPRDVKRDGLRELRDAIG